MSKLHKVIGKIQDVTTDPPSSVCRAYKEATGEDLEPVQVDLLLVWAG